MTLRVLFAALAGAAIGGSLPAARAGAYATVSPPPVAIGRGALPDGRRYEQVTPAIKNGNYVASGGLPVTEQHGYAAASADGNAVTFLGSGAMGDAASSILGPYVSRRSASGWSTSSALPPQQGVVIIGDPQLIVPSSDFAAFVFGTVEPYSPEQPLGPSKSVNLYRSEDPFSAPTWLGRPTTANPIPSSGENTGEHDFVVAGGAPSLSTVYFSYSGTLVAEDESRAPNVGSGTATKLTDPWGFYEWTGGTLRSAGVLPQGTVSAFGAVPAAIAGDEHNVTGAQAADFDNEVSADGARAFFVSPDPVASSVTDPGGCESEGPCAATAPELYVRETLADGSKRTVLVSQSQMPGHVGEAAPNGPASVVDALIQRGGPVDSTDVYASRDGSQAFFASVDRLTPAAPEGSSVKEYDFDLRDETLTYLPGVVGPIVAAAQNGSSILFENTAATPQELDAWRAGPSGGEVTPVAQLPVATEIGEPYGEHVGVEARASADGSAFVFDTNAPVPGFANNGSGFGEVYRYDAMAGSLSCLSCAPAGIAPSGNAVISYDNHGGTNSKPKSTVDTRVISSDGGRVFFDSPDPLSPQAANGKRNVYEWERAGLGGCDEAVGCLYLISSGTGPEDAFYLDSSESGDDVFFNTSTGLAAEDADEAYDVYDARVAHPGDAPPPAPAASCEGGSCQAQSAVPDLLGALPSAAVTAPGNLAPGASQPPAKKAVHKKKKKKKKKKRKWRHASKRSHKAAYRRKGARR